MSLKLKDMIYSAWVIIASEEDMKRVIMNFAQAIKDLEKIKSKKELEGGIK